MLIYKTSGAELCQAQQSLFHMGWVQLLNNKMDNCYALGSFTGTTNDRKHICLIPTRLTLQN